MTKPKAKAAPAVPQLEVIYRSPKDLRGYAKNARTHSAEQVTLIRRSINEFTFTNPILLKDDGVTVGAGHGRLAAALLPPIIESVPTITLHGLTDEQWRAYVITDNQSAINGSGWDMDLLRGELADLKGLGFDLSIVGFDAFELGEIFGGEKKPADPDLIPDEPSDPVSVKGDLWLVGAHRLLCGDATSVEDVERCLDGKKANVCLTDPPYGIEDTKSVKNNYAEYVDSKENLIVLIEGFLPIARSVAKVVVLTPGISNHRLYPAPTWTMAWFTPAGTGTGPWGFCCWQPILCYGKDPKLAAGKGRHPDAVVHTESSEKVDHPCAKPIGFWKWLLERVSQPGDIVFEPFSGSGTSIIACELSGRTCFAVELSPAYIDVAVKRWMAVTGENVFHEDGRTWAEVEADRAKVRVPN
jgi:hypothetical protein